MPFYSGYTLDLYCDNEEDKLLSGGEYLNEHSAQYTGELGSECRSRARQHGWIIGKRVLCPKCSGKLI